MRVLLKILTILACVWAVIPPSVYGFIFTVVADQSAVIDIFIVACCICLAVSSFKRVHLYIQSLSFLMVAIASIIGFFHYFQDSGASGPLPYEWLNSYYLHSLPLLIIFTATRLGKKYAIGT